MKLKATEDNLPASNIEPCDDVEDSEESEGDDSLFGADEEYKKSSSSLSNISGKQSREEKDVANKKCTEKWSKKKKTKENVELDLMKKLQTAIESPSPPISPQKEQDADDLFGLMVTKELKALSGKK